jgi:hypothetical protein
MDYAGNSSDAAIRIALPGAGDGRAALENKEDLSYTLLFSGPDGRSEQRTARWGETVTLRAVPGRWTVTVTAWDGNAKKAVGEDSLEVRAGSDNSLPVKMAVYTEVSDFEELKSAVEDGTDDDFIVVKSGFSGAADDAITLSADKKVIIVAETDVTLSRDASLSTTLLNVVSGRLILGSPAYTGILTIDGNGPPVGGPLVLIGANASFTMNSGVLTNSANTASNGGGVTNNGVFTMNGGTIIGNSAEGNGGGVYNNGVFVMSGAAQITADNDVYLAAGKTITVSGPLTQDVAAQVTPASPVYKTAILTPGFPEGSPGKFAVSGSGYYLTAAGKLAGENIILATLPNQTILDTHYVSSNEIYVLTLNEAALTYNLSKWNGDSIVPVDTYTAASGTYWYGKIAYKDSGEYYAIYRDGPSIVHSTILRKYVNGTMASAITIPWQFGSYEGGFWSFAYFDNRLFLTGASKSDPAKIFTVDTSPLSFNNTPVYTRNAPGAWGHLSLHLANGGLYFLRGTNSGSYSEVVFAKWNGSNFTEICTAVTDIPGGSGVFPIMEVVKDDSTLFITTITLGNAPRLSRLDKLTVGSATAWNPAENIYNFNPPDPPDTWMWVTAGDSQGHWRRRTNDSLTTYDIIRFDYGTNTETVSYTDIPFGAGHWNNSLLGDSGDSGDADHLAYTVRPNATDTDLRLITLP